MALVEDVVKLNTSWNCFLKSLYLSIDRIRMNGPILEALRLPDPQENDKFTFEEEVICFEPFLNEGIHLDIAFSTNFFLE